MLKRSFSSKDRGLKATVRLASGLMRELNCPRSLTLLIMLRYGEWDQIAQLQCDPVQYGDPEGFHRAYLATNFLAKYEGLPTSFDRKQAALTSFLDGEKLCGETNSRLINTWDSQQGAMRVILTHAVKSISELLGDCGVDTINQVLELGRWGKGVTSSCKGLFLSHYNKLQARPECTPELGAELANALMREFPHWAELHPEGAVEIGGNSVTFVPKNAKTDRSIAIEPHINAFLQRGVGRLFARKLRGWGINLRSQEWNRELARRGAMTDRFATIDLKNASNSVSREAVYRLLPSEWSDLLDRLRSWRYTLDPSSVKEKTWVRYNMHSSMGNGYTFELETLVFTAVVRAVYRVVYGRESTVPYAVYGDDIIVGREATSLVIQTLSYLGFETNAAKTFTQGPFRESCGADWYHSAAVRPFFFKKADDVLQVIEWANWLRVSAPEWLEISSLWWSAHRTVPVCWRFLGPKGAGGVFYVNQYESSAVCRWSPLDGWHYRFKAARFKPLTTEWSDKTDHSDSVAAVCAALSFYRVKRVYDPMAGFEPLSLTCASTARDSGTWNRKASMSIDWPLVRIVDLP